jgi:pimeloyl-ACP methyl ester carboxylesterase
MDLRVGGSRLVSSVAVVSDDGADVNVRFGWLLAVLLSVLAGCSTASANPGLVDVGEGRLLYLACQGKGTPTVVLEAGGMGNSKSWSPVQPAIAEFTQVCAYDRAGEGHSSSLPAHDSFEAMVRDLHALLEAGGIEGPYVVMGHSFGGRLIPHFANLYPNDVVGMVLLDPGHEDFPARAEAALTPLEWQQYQEAGGARISDFEEAQDPGNLGAPGDFPLVVISAAHAIDRPGVSSEVNEKLYDLLVSLHREMAALSPDGTHIIADGSGHGIQIDSPDLVVDTIRQVVESARNEGNP